MLGNDVVDLLDVDARPETFHRRFDLRVFAAEERRAIAGDARPHALRWAHWGAKEAAYKLARQLDPKFVFSPARLVARFEPALALGAGLAHGSEVSPRTQVSFERRGRLELASGPPGRVPAIALKSFETPESVHVVALVAGSDWGAVVMAAEPLSMHSEAMHSETMHSEVDPSPDASLAVRRLALREIARALGVEAGRLAIGRQGRIPTVEFDGRTAEFGLSLSHHGRFVAFAFSPRSRGLTRERGDGGGRGERAERGDSIERAEGVGQVDWAVGCPVGAADTAWMVG